MVGKPKVLVSNDDGITAPGIVALVSALGKGGFCDVFVSAPTEERSASSHAITLGQQITAVCTQMTGECRCTYFSSSAASNSYSSGRTTQHVQELLRLLRWMLNLQTVQCWG